MILDKLEKIQKIALSPLDLIPHNDLREKIVDLVLRGVPSGINSTSKLYLSDFRQTLLEKDVENTRVVVFGGGTGLSNIIGGDSRQASWVQNPFIGLKEIFPQTKSIVCVTDNGGSTGELLKDLPLIAMGDIRHVLLSSIQLSNLQKKYMVTAVEANGVAKTLSDIFNLRFSGPLMRGDAACITLKETMSLLPGDLKKYLTRLFDYLFSDERLSKTLLRSHCLGNLLIVAAIYREIDGDMSNMDLVLQPEILHFALFKGLNSLAREIGANERAVLPCTSTPAQLRVLYTNGVEIPGEHKLSTSKRGYPVDSVHVDYFNSIRVFDEVLNDISDADILILAPGSLYSSIIPIFKVPCLADAVRKNTKALKILISNLWVQAGETDLSIADPDRKFYVSDMIKAYEKNIPGGTQNLFNEVLCISLKDIPGSVLQRYAVENKIPIFLDREAVLKQNYIPVECGFYSEELLDKRGFIQHDPHTLALAIKALFNGRKCYQNPPEELVDVAEYSPATIPEKRTAQTLPFQKHFQLVQRLNEMKIVWVGVKNKDADIEQFRKEIVDILWDHPVIPIDHLQFIEGICFIEKESWNRDQRWDNVFSFFDPDDGYINIRGDLLSFRSQLEVALIIAIGESLLGDYAAHKIMQDVVVNSLHLGKVYHLYLKSEKERACYFNHEQLRTFLILARMCLTDDDCHYTRLVNKDEGFTPPGLLMGLVYAWYIDNRFATNIEYKMSVTKISHTNLIPEQMKMAERRRNMIEFYKKIVFKACG